MRVENSLPASFSSAGKLQAEMAELGAFSHENLRRTWLHELAHYYNDEAQVGEFGYVVNYEITNGMIFASFVCYYLPRGVRTPEQYVQIASGPGFSDMSSQDWKVYNSAWRSWVENIEREKAKKAEKKKEAERKNEEKERRKAQNLDKISKLLVIPRLDGEDLESYRKRARLIEKFGQKIDRLSERGEIDNLEGLKDKDVGSFIKNHKNELNDAFAEVCEDFLTEQSETFQPGGDIYIANREQVGLGYTEVLAS